MKVVRLVMAGFTEATMETTLSRDTPIAFAYRGRVMNALQKQAKAVLSTILAASPVTAALRLCPSCYIPPIMEGQTGPLRSGWTVRPRTWNLFPRL